MAPIGEKGSSIREHSDRVLKELVGPAAEENGLRSKRADDINRAGDINDHVVEMIANAPFAVADLTELNPNVMYELALRHAVRKPVALIAREGTKLPFDVRSSNTIYFEFTPASLEDAKTRLSEQIRHRDDAPGSARWKALETSEPPRLTDEQTRNLTNLHQHSAAFRIYEVVDDTINDMEERRASFNEKAFLNRIENALMESRKLCAAFESRRVGHLVPFFEKTFTTKDLHKSFGDSVAMIRDSSLTANEKRKRFVQDLRRIQNKVAVKLEQRLNDTN
jgi:hypothetical protein